MDPMTHTPHSPPRSGLRLGSRFVLLAFLAIGGFFLVTEHAAHLFGVLPYLLALACPLLHLLHHGHGGHGHHGDQQPGEDHA